MIGGGVGVWWWCPLQLRRRPCTIAPVSRCGRTLALYWTEFLVHDEGKYKRNVCVCACARVVFFDAAQSQMKLTRKRTTSNASASDFYDGLPVSSPPTAVAGASTPKPPLSLCRRWRVRATLCEAVPTHPAWLATPDREGDASPVGTGHASVVTRMRRCHHCTYHDIMAAVPQLRSCHAGRLLPCERACPNLT